MFKTHRGMLLSDEEVIDSASNYVYSKMVEMDLSLPWFHVVITTISGGEESSQQVMPGDVEMFEYLIELAKGQAVSLDVQVMLPPQMTGRDGWSMERLASLHSARAKDNHHYWIYTTVSGEVFSCGDEGALSLDSTSVVRLIYPRP